MVALIAVVMTLIVFLGGGLCGYLCFKSEQKAKKKAI